MIHTTSEYRKAIQKNRTMYVICPVTFADGMEITLDSRKQDFFTGGLYREDAVSNQNSFDVGSAIIGQITLKLNNADERFSEFDFNGAVMRPEVGLAVESGIEWLKMGVYNAEPGSATGAMITVKALDNMAKFDRLYTESHLLYPTTLGAIIRDACGCCGVDLATDSASFNGDDIVVASRPEDANLTFRQILLWVGQITCHWCKCNVNGQMTLGWYDLETYESRKQFCDGGTFRSQTDAIVDGGSMHPWTKGGTVDGGSFSEMQNYHHVFAIASKNISTDDVVITGIRVIEKASDEANSDDIIYQSGEDGYVLTISGNAFIQNGQGASIAVSIGQKLIGVRFRPLSVSSLSDPSMEAGDIAYVTDNKGITYWTLITNTNFQVGSFQKVACDAESPIRNSAERFSQGTQWYQELRRKLKRDKAEWVKAMEDLSNRLDVSGGLYCTIETQEDGSQIFYLHDKAKLDESRIVWKMTKEAWGVSTDGGKTWNGGMTVDGDVISRILNTIGLNADWINTGALVVRDSKGRILFNADIDTGRVDIVADSFMLRGKTIEEIAQEGMEDYVDAAVTEAVKTVSTQHFFAYDPTLENLPSVQWDTPALLEAHIDDLFYNTMTKKVFRFIKKEDGAFLWEPFEDEDVRKALEAASNAQDTADGKRRVFVTTPIPPYDAGDMWVTSTEDGQAAIMICKTTRESGVFSSNDWIDPKYVDKSQVDGAIQEFDTSLGQSEVFNKLTNGGANQGIYIENGQLYINANYILAGVLAGKRINAKGIQVLDKNNNTTFFIDEDGNVTIRATTFSLSGQTIQGIANSAANSYANSALSSANQYTDNALNNFDPVIDLNQQEIFNTLTNNGEIQGIYLQGGKIYINGTYIKSGSVDTAALAAGAVTAGKISVADLQAIGATIGGFSISSTRLTSSDGSFYLSSSNANSWIYIKGHYTDTAGTGKDSECRLRDGILSLTRGDGVCQVSPERIYFTRSGQTRQQITAEADYSDGSWSVENGYQNVIYSTAVYGKFSVRGSKNRIAETDHYGERLLSCYEMPTPMFGDVGCGRTNEEGVCIVEIDPVFSETIGNGEYQVFLQEEGSGRLYVPKEEKRASYFIVRGTPDLPFSWELKCKQRDYETDRLQSYDDTPNPISHMTTSYALEQISDIYREMEELLYE